MIYIFEDKEDSALSKIFELGFNKSGFVWAGGNDRIIEHIVNGNKHVAFIDIMFDNAYTVDAFNKLVDKSTHETPILPVPIISMEYYYLELCRIYNQILNDRVIEVYRNMGDFREYLRAKGIKAPRNMENFLKYCIKQEVTGCSRVGDNIPRFMREDCICSTKYNRCNVNGSTKDKIREFYRLFPLVPFCNELHNTSISYMDGASIVLELIDKVNLELKNRGVINILKKIRMEDYT